MNEAEKYRVLPIDDRSIERFDPAMAGRPDLMAGRKSLTVYEGMTGMMENAFINVKNQSFNVTAELDIPAGTANGVILAQGGRFGGWSRLREGRPSGFHLQLRRPVVNTRSPAASGSRRQCDDDGRLRL